MAIAASGQISIGGPTAGRSINLEINNPIYAQSSMNDPEFRRLSTKTTDQSTESLSDFYSKTYSRYSGYLLVTGGNYYGQLGTGNRLDRYSLTQVGSLTDWSDISYNELSTGAIKSGGTLWTWGWGYNSGRTDNISRSSPVQVGTLTDWKNIYKGVNFSLATKTNGQLWAWGYNTYGELGTNNRISRSSPVQVGTLTDWKNIAISQSHSLAVKTGGTLWAWGGTYNLSNPDFSAGYLDTSRVPRSSPIQIGTLTTWSQVACGYEFSAAIKTDGTLWTWGRNGSGQLGNGSTNNTSSPMQVGTLTNWEKISCGYSGMAALKTDGTLWIWGNGGLGIYTSPIPVGSLRDWAVISQGRNHLMMIKTNGTLWGLGSGIYGELGLGYSTYNSPVQISSLTNWKHIACGYHASFTVRQ